MKSWKIILALLVGAAAIPALAQFGSDREKFLQAVEKRDGGTASELLKSNPNVVDMRNGKGDTPLILAIRGGDPAWVGFLLDKGANPGLAAANGDTPLIAAARQGMIDAVGWLLGLKVKVDSTNRAGETALIIAVQQRNAAMVRALLEAGADPDRADSVAGLSARDYAKRDTRGRDILRLITAGKR